MKSTKPIYTIGHRNPDTDSICSAIGYAHLKQALGENVVAARAGKINAETKYALEHFQVEQPLLLTDLYPRVKDITIDCKIVVKQHDTLRHLGEVMREHDLKSVPVTDSKGVLVGIVTVSDLAQRYFQELGMQNLANMRVRYRDIIQATDSQVLVSGEEGEFIKGNVRIAAGSLNTIKSVIKPHDIVLIGDRHDETIIDCVKQGIACLIVTGNGRVSPDVIEEAEESHVFVLSTPYDTYTVARLINQCVPIRRIMHDNPVCFKPMDLLSDIKGAMEENNYRNYPVVENGHLVGLQTEDFDGGACGFAEEEPRVDDLGVVEQQEGIGREQVRDVVETAFGDGTAAIDKEFGVVALVKREFGDAIVGQWVVVVGYSNGFRIGVH